MFNWLSNLFSRPKAGYYECYAPGCQVLVYLTKEEARISKRQNAGRVVVLCPEHYEEHTIILERMTAGRISDNNPNTNPDLEPVKVE